MPLIWHICSFFKVEVRHLWGGKKSVDPAVWNKGWTCTLEVTVEPFVCSSLVWSSLMWSIVLRVTFALYGIKGFGGLEIKPSPKGELNSSATTMGHIQTWKFVAKSNPWIMGDVATGPWLRTFFPVPRPRTYVLKFWRRNLKTQNALQNTDNFNQNECTLDHSKQDISTNVKDIELVLRRNL